MAKIILASSSPRRQKILKQVGIPFTILPSDIDEDLSGEMSPYEAVKTLSERKAACAVGKMEYPAVIVAADTIVDLNGKIIGKPSDKSDAFNILKKLQGKRHSVYTGVCIINKTADDTVVRSIIDNAAVFMRPMTDDEIRAYIETGEPMDKAGAYAIQEKGSLFVERIEGDFYTVEGLPIVRVYQELKNMGVGIDI